MDYKQVILVRQDLKLPKGKMAAQVAHASVDAAWKAPESDFKTWKREGSKKVVLKVDNLDELLKYKQDAKSQDLTWALITDAGHTVLRPGTITCLAIGPNDEEAIDRLTGNLKMMN